MAEDAAPTARARRPRSEAPKLSIDTQWFKDRMADVGISQRKLADMIELDHSLLSRTFDGKRRLQLSEAGLLAVHLHVAPEEVIRRAGIQAPWSDRTAKYTHIIDRQGRLTAIAKWGLTTEAPPRFPSNGLVARVQDTGSLYDGWSVFWAPRSRIDVDSIGKLCVVTLADGTMALRFVRQGYEPGSYNLTRLEGEGEENAALTATSPVLWIAP